MLFDATLQRYARQIPLIGLDGQRKLARTSVLIVGVGGLGTAVATYLAALGIGRLVLVDGDRVSRSDLNRQILYDEDDVGKPKALVAAIKLKKFNPFIEVVPVAEELNEKNVDELVKEVDAVVDALDNWRTRFLLNDRCVAYRKPLVHGGVEGFYGQITTIIPRKTPCLRCIYPSSPREKSEIPIIAPVAGVVAMYQAMEVAKLVLGIGDLLICRMMIVDMLHNRTEIIPLERNPQCPICSS